MRIHVGANFIEYFLGDFLKEASLILLTSRLHIIHIFSFECIAQSYFAVLASIFRT